jgi:hypothetical protein
MSQTYDEIIMLNKGEQVVDEVPDWFPEGIATNAAKFLSNVGRIPWPYTPAEVCFPRPNLRATLVRSTCLDARVQQDESGAHIVTIPIGLLARVWVLGRLLLTFWDNRYNIALLNSPFDDFDPDLVFMPEKYRSIFGDIDDIENYWQSLRELNDSIPDVSPCDVDFMTLFVLYFVVFHEMHHIHFRHTETKQAYKDAGKTAQLGEIERGFELQADDFASRHVLRWLIDSLEQDGYDSEQDYRNLFTRLSYGVTMFLGLMNPTWKYLHCYRNDSYAHPTIRHQVFAIATYVSLGAGETGLSKMWRDAERDAWRRCIQAFTALSLHMMADHESERPPGKIIQPIQDLMYGGLWSAQKLDQMVDEELTLLAKATDLSYRYLKTKQI